MNGTIPATKLDQVLTKHGIETRLDPITAELQALDKWVDTTTNRTMQRWIDVQHWTWQQLMRWLGY